MEKVIGTEYIKTPLKSVFTVRAVYTVHYFRYAQLFEFAGESHPFWEFVYIDSGTASITADGRKFDMSQGDAYFHKPNEFHTIKTDDRSRIGNHFVRVPQSRNATVRELPRQS